MLWSRSLVLCMLIAALRGISGASAGSVLFREREDGGMLVPDRPAGVTRNKPDLSSADAAAATTTSAVEASSTSTAAAGSETTTAPGDADALPPKDDDVPVCHVDHDSPTRPFCLPKDKQPVYVGETYHGMIQPYP